MAEDEDTRTIGARPKLYACPVCGLVVIRFVNVNGEDGYSLGKGCSDCGNTTVLLRACDWQTTAIKHLLQDVIE